MKKDYERLLISFYSFAEDIITASGLTVDLGDGDWGVDDDVMQN